MPDPLMLSVSGCRGTFGGSLTPEVVARFASAFATFIRERRATAKGRPLLTVSYDGRAKGDDVYGIATSALKLAGCDVAFLGIDTTPGLGFAADRLGADAGLQISASHNPQNWCGLKPVIRLPGAKKGIVSAAAPNKAAADRLIHLFRHGPLHAAPWNEVGIPGDFGHDGREHGLAVGDALHKLKVVADIQKSRFAVALDTVAGSGSQHTPFFLKALRAKVHELYPYPDHYDGVFPHTPEPTRENLTAMCKAVKKFKAHVGFAQDPDADRLAIVDERGHYIGEEYTLVLAALALGELGALKKGSVIPVNLSTSRMIEDAAARFGCAVLRTPVGEANVVEAMRADNSPLGGEGNGGVIWPRITYIRDSLSAMGLTLALMARRKQPLSAIVADIPVYSIIKRKVDLARPGAAALNPAGVLARVADRYAAQRPDLRDGVWINFPDRRAWLHVRASNTEPILRLIAEAPTAAEANAILDDAATLVG